MKRRFTSSLPTNNTPPLSWYFTGSARITRNLLFALLLLLFGKAAVAQVPECAFASGITNYYEVLLDLDNDPATGGSVELVQAGELVHDEPGFEQIHRVYTGCDGADDVRVLAVSALTWTGAGFAGLMGPVGIPYPVGFGNGFNGGDVVEWEATLSGLGTRCVERAVFHASINDSQFNDYTAAVAIGNCQGNQPPPDPPPK